MPIDSMSCPAAHTTPVHYNQPQSAAPNSRQFAHQQAVAMAMPSSKQSTTTADTTDTSECHTLCPYLHIKTARTRGVSL